MYPVLALFLSLALISPALAQPIAVGQRPPALDVSEWVTSPPAKDAGITVVMFIGTWCPVTRTVLDLLDPTANERSLQIVAITPEDSPQIRTFLDIGDWQHVVAGTDPEHRVRSAWFGDSSRNYSLPYAFVIAGRGKGRILWHGRVAQPSLDDPMVPFEATLDAVAAGTWTVDEAVASARRYEAATSLLQKFGQGTSTEWYDAQLDELEGTDIPATTRGDAAYRLNQIAWALATEQPDDAALSTSLRAVEMALALGGDRDPAILDTQARVLWELERKDEALEIQQAAVDLARGTHWEPELISTLCSYATALGAALPGACTPGPWQGSLNQAFEDYPGDGCILVRPGTQEVRALENAWSDEMIALASRFFQGTPLRLPDNISDDERANKLLVLYGTPEDNPLTRAVLEHHGITLDSNGVMFGATKVALADPFLIAALPSPWRADLPVMVYTAAGKPHAHNLNRVFHGPTSVVLGSASGGDDAYTIQADAQLDDNVVVALEFLPAELTHEEAIADLEALHVALRDRYAGYADLEWSSRAASSTMKRDLQEFVDRLAAQDTWSGREYFDLVLEYLEPVQDTHFHISVTTLETTGAAELRARLVKSLEPYFTDGVVDGEGLDLEVVPPPHLIERDTVYLFPTLPRGDVEPAYLVGVLADPADPPTTIDLVQGGATVTVPVHRSRTRDEGRDRGWGVATPPDTPLPVLTVTTMRESSLRGLDASADSLRQEPTAVLDLRGNGGGSDSPARAWCSRFSHQGFRWGCHAQVDPTRSEPLRHWRSGSDHSYILHGGDAAVEPYAGQLFVLTDTNVASSGETFAMLASQIDGALVVGENTAGCMDYGNADQHLKLPHSRIDLWFGRSRFVWQCVRPAAEGVGLFPDYWLDEETPIQWLSDNAVE